MSEITREGWGEWMEPTLRETYGLGFNYGNIWERLFRIEESEKRREEVAEYVHPDVIVQTDEGTPYKRLQVRKAYLSSVINLEFSGEVKITQQFIEDNMYREISEETYGLGNAVQRKIAKDGASQFFNGFSSVTTPDGLSLFNGSHTLKYGGTTTSGNNQNIAFSSDAFAAARQDLLSTLDENASINPFGEGRLQVIVPPGLDVYANQVARSPYQSDVANNAVNVFDIEVICWPTLAEATQAGYSFGQIQWYVRDPMLARNYFFWRIHPESRMVDDIASAAVLFQTRTRYSYLTSSWRGMWGSKG